jgi:hypothetical protein
MDQIVSRTLEPVRSDDKRNGKRCSKAISKWNGAIGIQRKAAKKQRFLRLGIFAHCAETPRLRIADPRSGSPVPNFNSGLQNAMTLRRRVLPRLF